MFCIAMHDVPFVSLMSEWYGDMPLTLALLRYIFLHLAIYVIQRVGCVNDKLMGVLSKFINQVILIPKVFLPYTIYTIANKVSILPDVIKCNRFPHCWPLLCEMILYINIWSLGILDSQKCIIHNNGYMAKLFTKAMGRQVPKSPCFGKSVTESHISRRMFRS